MALHIQQIPVNNVPENNYLHPQQAQEMIPQLSENEIRQTLYRLCYGENNQLIENQIAQEIAFQYFTYPILENNIENDIENQNNEIENIEDFFLFNVKQYLIRYYICKGEINNIINVLDENNGYDIQYFINYRHPHFQYNTILHDILKWCPDVILISHIFNNGGYVNIANEDNYFPEENIHNTIWYNPFYQFGNNQVFILENQFNQPFYRNANDYIEAIQYITDFHFMMELDGEEPIQN